MNSVLNEVLVGIIVAIIGCCLSWLTGRAAVGRAQDLAEQKKNVGMQRVDGEAYSRAQKINKDIVADLEEQIERLGRRAAAAEQLASVAERRADLAEQRVNQLESEVRTLRRTIQNLAKDG